ncbi:MAG: hypothetical protein R2729_20375 [Bryobacteraceae bacterium]
MLRLSRLPFVLFPLGIAVIVWVWSGFWCSPQLAEYVRAKGISEVKSFLLGFGNLWRYLSLNRAGMRSV